MCYFPAAKEKSINRDPAPSDAPFIATRLDTTPINSRRRRHPSSTASVMSMVSSSTRPEHSQQLATNRVSGWLLGESGVENRLTQLSGLQGSQRLQGSPVPKSQGVRGSQTVTSSQDVRGSKSNRGSSRVPSDVSLDLTRVTLEERNDSRDVMSPQMKSVMDIDELNTLTRSLVSDADTQHPVSDTRSVSDRNSVVSDRDGSLSLFSSPQSGSSSRKRKSHVKSSRSSVKSSIASVGSHSVITRSACKAISNSQQSQNSELQFSQDIFSPTKLKGFNSPQSNAAFSSASQNVRENMFSSQLSLSFSGNFLTSQPMSSLNSTTKLSQGMKKNVKKVLNDFF